MAPEMKIHYRTLAAQFPGDDEYESVAYVSVAPPHEGENRYTYEPVTVVWDDAYGGWVQLPVGRVEGPVLPPPPPPPNWRRQPHRTTRRQRG